MDEELRCFPDSWMKKSIISCHKQRSQEAKGLRVTGQKNPVPRSRGCLELRGKEERERQLETIPWVGFSSEEGPRP